MSINDGQPVNAAVTNAAFISRLTDSDTIGEIDLKNASYTDLISLQRIINELLDSLGVANQAATDAAADDYSSNNVVVNGDNRKVAIGKIDERFNGTTGHTHDGTDGEGAAISATNLADFNNLFAEFGEYTFDAASGTSIDVTSLFSSQSPGGDASTEGVITSAPNNYIPIVEKTTGGEIEDAQGDRVFGRLTESASVWTLSFYTNEAGVETAHSLASQDIRFLYREVFTAANRPTIGANVGVYDTQSAIGDIPDASASQRGVVSTGAQTFQGAKNFLVRPTVNSNDVVDVSAAQTIQFKDYDGGTASNTSRMTIPKNTKANLDALTRKEATIVYATDESKPYYDDGVDLVAFGTGAGGGGLDVWHTEDFEDTTASDFTSGNNATFDNGGVLAGTLADETVSPIAGASSVKYTQASGSLNDWFKSPTISVDSKQSGNTSGITLYFTYTGDPGDIQFVFYDETGSAVLTASEDLFTTQSNPTRYSTSVSIPSTTTSVSWGAQVKVENIGAVLVVDDVEFSTDPFVIQKISLSYESQVIDQNNNFSLTGSDWIIPTTNKIESGDNLLTFSTPSYSIYTANQECTVTVSSSVFGTLQDQRIKIIKNASTEIWESERAYTTNEAINTATSFRLQKGEYFRLQFTVGAFRAITNAGYFRVTATADSPALVTPAKAGSEFYSREFISGLFWDSTGAVSTFDTSFIPLTGSKLLEWNDTTETRLVAKEDVIVDVSVGATPSADEAVRIYKNGSSTFLKSQSARTGIQTPVTASLEVRLQKGEWLHFTVTGAFDRNGSMTISARPFEAQFLAAIPEDLGVKPALYETTTLQSTTSGVELRVNFGTLLTDQDSLVSNPTTDWKYTAPKDGVYEISTGVYFSSLTWGAGQTVQIRLRVNGTPDEYLYYKNDGHTNTGAGNYFPTGTIKKVLSKGDEIQIFAQQNSGSNVDINGLGSYISITREQTPVSFGGDIRQESVVVDLTSGTSPFTQGEATVTRQGRQVTVTMNNLAQHPSATTATTDNIIPSWARPPSGTRSSMIAVTGILTRMDVDTSGKISFVYFSNTLALTSTTGSGTSLATITYNVD